MTARIDLAKLEQTLAATLHWRDENRRLYHDGTIAARVACDTYAGMQDKLAAAAVTALPALIASVRAANKLSHDAVPNFDTYEVSPSLMKQMDAALSAFDFKEETK